MSNVTEATADEKIRTLLDKVQTLEDGFESLTDSTDAFFLIVIGTLIFFMQGGFAFLEAGSVR